MFSLLPNLPQPSPQAKVELCGFVVLCQNCTAMVGCFMLRSW